MDIRKYWKARRDLEATLEEATYLTSVQDDARGWIGGRVFACGRETAARCLVEGTHKRSTPSEIEREHTDMAARNAVCAAMTAQAAKKTTLTIDADLARKMGVTK
jgi:hypothetical protein